MRNARQGSVLQVMELESREVPAAQGLLPGAPPPLATSGLFNGIVTLFPALQGIGQFSTAPAGEVIPFPGFNGTVRTAFGDVNGDFVQDLIAVTGPGTPLRVAVLSGTDFDTYIVAPFDPFGGNFTGGGFVAAGDFDFDNRADIVVTPDQGGGPRVSIYSVLGFTPVIRANFLGIDDANFRGGARPAAGDFNSDGFTDLAVAAGPGGGPRIAVYDGQFLFTTNPPTRLVGDFFAFSEPSSQNLRDGVYIAAGDLDGDRFSDLIIGAGTGGAPRVVALSGRLLTGGDVSLAQDTLLASYFAGDPTTRGGIRVAAKPIGIATINKIATGSGILQPSEARAYFGQLQPAGEPTQFQSIDPYGVNLIDGVYVG